jgi:hypothetical protein
VPVVATTPALKSPPSNAYGLVQYLQTRLPGYDPSEYLRELNSAYIHVWEEITKLKNNYFTNIVTVTVAKAQTNYDLMFNADGGLSAPISARLYQITKVRLQPPSGGLFQTSLFMSPNDPDFVSLSAFASPQPTQSGPYYAYLSGRNNINWAMPLAVGTKMEVTYTFWPLALTYLFAGAVSSSGVNVTGVATGFTQLLQPDFQVDKPTVQGQEEIPAEFICNGQIETGGQVYRVTTITSDTALTTKTAIAPVLPVTSPYVLAVLPEIPREHIRVVAAIALRSMYSVAGDDARVNEWTAISTNNMQMMKDALIERQGQNPPRKIRFPYGISRRNRAFLR